MKINFKNTDCEIFCPSCRAYIRDNEWFGEYIGEDENYCKICGQKLEWETPMKTKFHDIIFRKVK